VGLERITPKYSISQCVLERTDAIKNEILKPITFVLAYLTVLLTSYPLPSTDIGLSIAKSRSEVRIVALGIHCMERQTILNATLQDAGGFLFRLKIFSSSLPDPGRRKPIHTVRKKDKLPVSVYILPNCLSREIFTLGPRAVR
jgi:hypothetical protein